MSCSSFRQPKDRADVSGMILLFVLAIIQQIETTKRPLG
jgi:hypothetical protein